MTSIIGAVAIEIFEGKHFGSIYGTLTLAALAGGAAGPWITGVIYDQTGSYAAAFWIGLIVCALSILVDLDGRPAQDPRGRRPDAPVAARGVEPLTSAAECPAAAAPPSGSGR